MDCSPHGDPVDHQVRECAGQQQRSPAAIQLPEGMHLSIVHSSKCSAHPSLRMACHARPRSFARIAREAAADVIPSYSCDFVVLSLVFVSFVILNIITGIDL